MECVKLKVSPIKLFALLFTAFVSFLAIIILLHGAPISLHVITTAFWASLVTVIPVVGIIYFSQKEVVLTEHGIKKVGFSSKSIAYNDIQRIKVGTGGFRIYDEAEGSISITTMYSNFSSAKKLFNQQISERNEIEINGFKFFINRYLKQK